MERIRQILNDVRGDRISGSGRLLKNLTNGLLQVFLEDTVPGAAELKILEMLLQDFHAGMRDFALVRHFTGELLAYIKGQKEISTKQLYNRILDYNRKWENTNTRLANLFLEKVSLSGKTILTHSQSSSIQELLINFAEPGETGIIQTESRPMYEGRKQAQELAAHGFEVSLITDTGYTVLMDDIDLVILGADSVWADCFVNKTGSWAIALIAARHDKPVYVLADSRKLTPAPMPPDLITPGNRPSQEIWEFPPEHVRAINHYFEAIPTRNITLFFFENRIIPGQEMPLIGMEKR